jgi:hypothetical protein
MGGLIASLLSIAPVVIGPTLRAVEALFGPKTGETKMKATIDALTPIIAALATAGKIPGIPDETTLRAVIEAVFQQNKAAIENPAAPPSTAERLILVPPGATVTIKFPEAK